MNNIKKERCAWAESNPLMIKYHDVEWGTPVHDDRKLFEFLILEGAQAGLSWSIVLKKRKNYRKAFDNLDLKRLLNIQRKILSDCWLIQVLYGIV